MTASLRSSFRRALLRRLAVAPLALSPLGASWLWAAPATGLPKFLLVFLRGGYDAANVLVPFSSDFYYESRPGIAIARPRADDVSSFGDGNAAAAIALDADWALHPALRDSVLPIYRRGEAAFVPFAGSDDLSRSHFETQDRIEFGQAAGSREFGSGFLNRLAAVLGAAEAIAFTEQLPVALRGERLVANVALKSVGRAGLDARQSALVNAMYASTRFAPNVEDGFATRDAVARELAAEMDGAGRGAIGARGFEQEARRIGRLLRERYDIGFVDVGGWDTHVAQGGATGYLAGRLQELGGGLAALADELGPRWRDTVVVVLSEFGRTFRENGNRGTDHGHGSAYWLLGGAVRGGRIAGEQVAVRSATLHQNRDWPVLNDYRSLLAGVFARLYALDGAQLARVFPGASAADIRLL